MSPEKADSAGVDIDTRTDIYSLGVVLYELLVGTLPLDTRKLPFDEALRKLREQDAPKPSTKVRTLGEQSTTRAQNRRAEVATLSRQLRGDLDAIALKALEKDRSRRYGTPSERHRMEGTDQTLRSLSHHDRERQEVHGCCSGSAAGATAIRPPTYANAWKRRGKRNASAGFITRRFLPLSSGPSVRSMIAASEPSRWPSAG